MILRIQQFEANAADRFAGWTNDGLAPIRAPLPAGTNAFELSVRETDEDDRSISVDQRRAGLREMTAAVADELRGETDQLVVRLDGPMTPGELLPAFRHLTDLHACGRFAVSAVAKFDSGPAVVNGGVRIAVSVQLLAELCADTTLGIDRGVRMRVFSVPSVLANPLLDIAELDDERWPDILEQTAFQLQNTHGLDALQIFSRLEPADFARRVGGIQSSIKSLR